MPREWGIRVGMAWVMGLPVALSKAWAVELAEPTRTTERVLRADPQKLKGWGRTYWKWERYAG